MALHPARTATRFTFCLLFLLTVGVARGAQTTLTVAADGTGQYKTVQEAINCTHDKDTAGHDVSTVAIVPGE